MEMRSCGPKQPFVIDSGFHIGVSWQICRHRFSRKKAVQRMQSIVVWSVYYSRKSSTTIKRLLHAGLPCNRTRIYAARVPRAADDARRPPNYAVLLPPRALLLPRALPWDMRGRTDGHALIRLRIRGLLHIALTWPNGLVRKSAIAQWALSHLLFWTIAATDLSVLNYWRYFPVIYSKHQQFLTKSAFERFLVQSFNCQKGMLIAF